MTSERSPAYQPCPVARSVDIIGDRWALLIVRDAFDGVRRFGDFQRGLGMARNILTDRCVSWSRRVFSPPSLRLTARRIRSMC